MLRSYFVLLLWLVIVAVVAVVVDMFIIITDVCIEICSTFVVVVFFFDFLGVLLVGLGRFVSFVSDFFIGAMPFHWP